MTLQFKLKKGAKTAIYTRVAGKLSLVKLSFNNKGPGNVEVFAVGTPDPSVTLKPGEARVITFDGAELEATSNSNSVLEVD